MILHSGESRLQSMINIIMNSKPTSRRPFKYHWISASKVSLRSLSDAGIHQFYMKVIYSVREKGIGRGVDKTGKRACKTQIHSLRGRLATPLPVSDYIIFMLRCETLFIGVS